MYCWKCGNGINSNDKFCHKCGQEIDLTFGEDIIDIPQNEYIIGEVKIKLLSVKKNTTSSACKSCSLNCGKDGCTTFKHNTHSHNLKQLIFCKADFRIINTSSDTINIFYELIDTKAQSYHGNVIGCSMILDENTAYANEDILPRTIKHVQVTFPEIQSNAEISTIRICCKHKTAEFILRPYDDEINDLFQIDKSNSLEDIETSNKYEAKINELLDKIEFDERFIFCPGIDDCDEHVKLQSINRDRNEIMSMLNFLLPQKRTKIEKILLQNKQHFEDKYELLCGKKAHEVSLTSYARSIINISPREFEIWCAELLNLLGYETTVTQYVGDGGIDIYAQKNSKKYAVQCKRYKGTVSAPDIQKFLGAMVSSQIENGIFITTSFFSVGALAIAKNNNIECYDIRSISNILQDFGM